jgi:hypothetical protein
LGNVYQAMSNETIMNALCYELMLFAIRKWQALALLPWTKLLLAHCKPFWAEWKTQQTLQAVDEQAIKLVEQWEKDERQHHDQDLANAAEKLFPDATIIPMPDAIVPSVMIIREAPEGASEGVKALGGELRITYQLGQS